MPIIFSAGYGDVPMTVQAMKAGAVEFIMKPIDDDELLSAIRHAIERSVAALGNEAEIITRALTELLNWCSESDVFGSSVSISPAASQKLIP